MYMYKNNAYLCMYVCIYLKSKLLCRNPERETLNPGLVRQPASTLTRVRPQPPSSGYTPKLFN